MSAKQTGQPTENDINKPSGCYLTLLELMVEEAYNFLDCPIGFGQFFSFPAPESLTLEKFRDNKNRCQTEEEKKEYLTEVFDNAINVIKIKGMKLKNITFPLFQDVEDDYSLLFNVIKNIKFKDCTFNDKSLSRDFSRFESNVVFEDCTFNENWQLENYPLTNLGLPCYVYSGCNFKKKIECIKPEIISISHPQFEEFCTFDEGVEFRNVQINANIFNVDSQPENKDKASQFALMKGKFKFTDCTFSSDQEIYLANAKEASFLLERCKFEKKFKIRGLEYTEGYEYQQKHKAALKSLTFNSCQIANNDDSYLRVGFLRNCDFSFKNFKNQASSELNIGDCHFKSFELTNFRNLGKFKLFKINIMDDESGTGIPNPCFKIDNTSIGNADFQSIDLTTFSKVFMFDNIFSEIDYTNVQWPSCISVDQFQGKKENEIAKKRDTYRTLKNIALKNNDQPQALTFYAKEMENHDEMTKWGNSQFGDKLTLRFNQFTNQFGMSWARPLGYLIYLSILFYGFLLISIGGALTLEHYWIFLNPMHKTEFIGEWNAWTYFIDLLFRLIQALLIYQTIQAFRKFTRPL